jgi:hypothetical protein
MFYAFIEVEQYMLRARPMSAAVRNPLKQKLQIPLVCVSGTQKRKKSLARLCSFLKVSLLKTLIGSFPPAIVFLLFLRHEDPEPRH